MSNYINYHCHSSMSNISTPDSTISNRDRAIRVSELGQKVLSGVEHGWCGRFIEIMELAKEFELKPLLGAEVYIVKNRFEKDRTNAHLILLAKNENGRKAINRILSEANISGFYYKARIDLELLFTLPKDDVWVTSACMAGLLWKYEDSESMLVQLHDYFQENFYLEVQNHNVESQKILNKKILDLSQVYNIKIIAGMDSHLISENQYQEREDYLLSRGIEYPEENNWYLDWPSYDEAFKRFKEQNILNQEQIVEALNNTNVFEKVESYTSVIFDSDVIKLPTLYPENSQEEKNQILENLIWEQWKKEKQYINQEKYVLYEEEIRKELDTVFITNMADYFLLDYEVIKHGKELGGQITLTGRGCFTSDAKIFTDNGIKNIDNVQIGDMVIAQDGQFHPVFDTMKYNISEDLLKIEYVYGGSESDNVCTLDHKIYINRQGKNQWIEAKNILPNDFVCSPKFKNQSSLSRIIDLNQYNSQNFDYDEEYIYERTSSSGRAYEYSPSQLARKWGVGKSVIENYANGKKNSFSRKKWIAEKFLTDTPFKNQEEYVEYIKNKKITKIRRFIDNDYDFNVCIGLLYGDGFTVKKNKNQIGLAINTETKKDKINKEHFLSLAKKLGCQIYEHASRTKKLSQIYISSFCLRKYVEENLFISKNGENKKFNFHLLNQDKQNLEGLWYGLMLSDGHFSQNENNPDNFDNTSPTIISAFKILNSCIGQFPTSMQIRSPHTIYEKYNCKKSYKIKIHKKAYHRLKKYEQCFEDDDFVYFPIKKISIIKNQSATVYDLSVLGNHSYVINNMLVHNSAPSFYLSKLLGFTTIDRISASVKLFPERFISAERLLETKSLPDIDFNLGNPEVFAQAQADILGDGHSYPMIAFGTVKVSGAWKLYSRISNIDFETANEVSEQLQKYEMDLKHTDNEEEKELLDVLDYIDPKYHQIFNESKKYLGLVNSLTPHPCGYIIFNHGDIREEFGLIKIKTGNVEHICACCDGLFAENYKLLKNDLLKVSVVKLIYDTYHRIGIEPHTLPELIDLCENNKKVWDVYANGWTKGINQFEQTGTRGRSTKYKPQNISELSAFVAAIRPGFKSNYALFESRMPFEYGIKSLDNLIQTKEFPYSFMLYQENAMQVMGYSSIPISKTYEIIKNIAKKRVEKVKKYKDQFVIGMKKKLSEEEKTDAQESKKIASMTWQIINDSSQYSFNASHSYSVAGDSLYGAYLKSHYPLEFYEVFLNILEEDADKDRLAEVKIEAQEAYHIQFPPLKFNQDNRKIVGNTQTKEISQSMKILKGFGDKIGEQFYELSQNFVGENFLDLLIYAEENDYLSSKWLTLIKLNYFEKFGNNQKLMNMYEEFINGENKYKKSYIEKTKIKRLGALKNIWQTLPNKRINFSQQLANEFEILGSIQSIFPNLDNGYQYFYVKDINLKYAPRFEGYNLRSAKQGSLKVYKKPYWANPFGSGDVIRCSKNWIDRKENTTLVEGRYVPTGTGYTYFLTRFEIVKPEELDKILEEKVNA